MLWTIVIILLVLWALGFGFAGQSLGALVHIAGDRSDRSRDPVGYRPSACCIGAEYNPAK